MESGRLAHQQTNPLLTMKTRRTYAPLRIDITLFVLIALLLILFFVWAKEKQRPVIMGVTVPAGCHEYDSPTHPHRLVTLYLLGDNQIGCMQHWYKDDMAQLQIINYATLGKVLRDTRKNEAAVVIKPSRQATFRNLADALNELKMAGNLPYLLASDLSQTEQRLLRHYENVFTHCSLPADTVFWQTNPFYASVAEEK